MRSAGRGWWGIPMLRAWLAIGLFWSCGIVLSAPVELNPSRPERYTVVPGDTLWDIAGRFLKQPWQWPEIWDDNRQIQNPHWIYPGDVLRLTEVDGKPRLLVEGRSESQFQDEGPSEVRLSPRIRVGPPEAAIPTIPMNAIRQFLTHPRVVSPEELASAPYVVSLAEEHIVGGAGNRIFVRSIQSDPGNAYTVYRAGEPYKATYGANILGYTRVESGRNRAQAYRDADTGEVLGYEAVYVADAQLEQIGDPATLLITSSNEEVRIGDRLLPFEPEPIRVNFQPHAPNRRISGHIIGVMGGVSQIGQYSVVAIDRGAADGIEIGDVLAIWQKGKVVRDIVGTSYGEDIVTPDQNTGLLMVFRTFDRVSYGLVLQATRFLHVFDIVASP